QGWVLLCASCCTYYWKLRKLSELISISPEEFSNPPVDIVDFLPRKWRNSSDLSFDSSEVSVDTSEEFFLSSEEIEISSGAIWEIPREESETSERFA
ncbi:hypothetical protein, partial [uncultured Porphyromonas sp.]|uniref:hypothetical protein n=1 Tax=uncultured Porphyromonas sp. TaxID=159274 RepID=UPI00266C50C7